MSGDGTVYTVPFDTIISDAWNMCAGGAVTLPVRGIWLVGGSICYTANFAGFLTATSIISGAVFNMPIDIVPAVPPGLQKNCQYGLGQAGAATYLQTEAGIVLTMEVTGLAGTKTLGILGTDAYPTMMWGYCLAETPTF